VQTSRRTMLCLLIVAIAIANIPGLTVTYLFLFYGTLRASTLLPTVMTLLGKKLTGKGVFAGVLTALCVGLPIFAYRLAGEASRDAFPQGLRRGRTMVFYRAAPSAA